MTKSPLSLHRSPDRLWRVAHGRSLQLGACARIMGIVNATPDSFSGDGLAGAVDAAVDQALAMVEQGADIIDIGGESTRPGAEPVTAAQEQARILPIVEALAARSETLISVDTYRAETAELSLNAGAHIINDIWGLSKDPEMPTVVAQHKAGLVVMHTGRERVKLPDVISDQLSFFGRALERVAATDLPREHIMLDPGFGFAKETPQENIELMARFPELLQLGYPLLAGTSRKRFVGAISGREAPDRDAATAATSVILRLSGADVFRVHNVAINKDALAVADAMLAQTDAQPENQ